MTVDLLRIMQAEQEAEALVSEARARQELRVKEALDRRKERLAAIKPAPASEPPIGYLSTDKERLKRVAQRNAARAVKAILEELRAAS